MVVGGVFLVHYETDRGTSFLGVVGSQDDVVWVFGLYIVEDIRPMTFYFHNM